MYRSVIRRLPAEKLERAWNSDYIRSRKKSQEFLVKHIVGIGGREIGCPKRCIGVVEDRRYPLKDGIGIVNHRAFIAGKTEPLVLDERSAQIGAKLL